MLLEYEVLISSNIQRKKPWSRLEWIGIQKESICLIDKKRISILYLPSGRTRRVIAPLKTYLKDVLYFTTSSSGEYVIGLLGSGSIIRWHKDSHTVKVISAYPSFTLSYGKDGSKVNMFISDDGQKILILFDFQKIHVWEQTNTNTEGEWSSVDLGLNALKSLHYRETAVDATFFANMIQGNCCLCTLICNNGSNLVIGCLLLQWVHDPNIQPNSPTFTSNVSYHEIPLVKLNPDCRPIRLRGAYVSCLSHDGQILAVAVNQRQPYQSNLVFIDPYTTSVVSSHLKGLGSQNRNVLAKFAKTYWIADMSWSHDDLFLVCISRRGSLFILSKLGEILHVKTQGKSVEFGPSLFIPLHPLFEHIRKQGKQQSSIPQQQQHTSPRPDSPNSLASSVISEKSGRQRYSVTTHPRLPLILCSDGYLVTAMQMVNVVRLSDVVTISLVEANRSVKSIIKDYDLKVSSNITPRFELPSGMLNPAKFREHRLALLYSSFKSKFKKKKKDGKINENTEKSADDSYIRDDDISMLKYKFEEEDGKTVNSEDEMEDKQNYHSPVGAILNADEGKILFDDQPTINISTDGWLQETQPICGESLLGGLSKCVDKLLTTWSLITTQGRSDYLSGGEKTLSDELHMFFLQTLKTICDVIKECQHLSHCLAWQLDAKDNDDQFNLQSLLCDLTTTFADQVTNLTSFDLTQRPVISNTLKIVLNSILSCHRTAAEGCTSSKDIAENLNLAFKFLYKAEKCLFNANSFQNISDPYSVVKSGYHQLNVVTSSYNIETLITQQLMLPSLWKKFYFTLVKFYETEAYKQINPAVIRLLSIVQRIVLPRLKLDDNLSIQDPTTLHNMHMNLCEYKLDSSLKLAACVLRDHLNSASKWEEENWVVVELLCSIMTSYFTDQPILFSSLYNTVDERFYSMERNLITSAVRSLRLSHTWTADHTINLLLCCGRIFEAASFACEVGDWKSAVAILAMSEKVRAFKQSYNPSLMLTYNKNSVVDILKTRIQTLISFTDINDFDFQSNLTLSESEVNIYEQLTQCSPDKLYHHFVDIFTVSVMTGCDLTTWFANMLLERLKGLCVNLDFMIPETLYLPSPPLYLPLPAPDEKEYQNRYNFLRHKISALIQTILTFFHSINLTQHAVSWYVKKLNKSIKHTNSSPLSTLSQSLPSPRDKILSSKECKILLSLFCNLLAFLWMFHLQENISLCLRKYQKLRECNDPYDQMVYECLFWIKKFIPFSKFLSCEDKMYGLVLCLCSSLPIDQFLVITLAEYFYNPSNISPKNESRFNEMRKKLKETNYNNTTDDSQEGSSTLKPMSVLYYKKCKSHAKKSRKNKGTYLFVEENESGNSKNLKMPFSEGYSFEKDLVYHNFVSQIFEVILSRETHISKKSSKRNRKSNQQNNLDDKIFVLNNRHKIAVAELEFALDLENVNQKRFLSRIGEDSISKENPTQFSTPKSSVKKAASLANLSSKHISFMDTSVNESVYPPVATLRRYFSQPEIHSVANGDTLNIDDDFNFECPKFEISDAPTSMQKRLLRLSSYMAWLQFWNEKPSPETQFSILKPSLRIKLTKNQLLQGLMVAEIRFGKGNLFSQASSVMPNSLQTEVNQVVDDEITTVSTISESVPPADKSDVVISNVVSNYFEPDSAQTTVKGNLIPPEVPALLDTDEMIPELPTEDNNKQEKVEVNEEKIEEEENKEKGDEEENEKEEVVPADEDEAISQPGTEACSELVDGGGKIRPKPPTNKSQSNADIASTVRSEINNVLLAQQVSLLSQLLLSQTLGQQPNINSSQNNLVSGVLQAFLPSLVPKNETSLKKEKSFSQSDVTLPKTVFQEEENIVPTHIRSQHEVYRPQKLNSDKRQPGFGIPLFHVEGITKTQKPEKNVNLVKTPKSIRGWNASVASKQTHEDLPVATTSIKPVQKLLNLKTVDKPLLISDLNTKQPFSQSTEHQKQINVARNQVFNDRPPLPSQGILKNSPQRQNPPQENTNPPLLKYPTDRHNKQAYKSRKPGPASSFPASQQQQIKSTPNYQIQPNLPENRPSYQTNFPILQKPSNLILNPPNFQLLSSKRTDPSFPMFSRVQAPPNLAPQQPPHQLIPRLIDPREVLVYENKKQQHFQQVKGFSSVKPTQPPVPIMKMNTPFLERNKHVVIKEPDKENVDPQQTNSQLVDQQNVVASVVDVPKVKKRKELPPFEGYLSQEEVSREVQLKNMGCDSSETMSQASAHYLASVGKQVKPKPRMKDAQAQVIIKDEQEPTSTDEEEDYKDKLTTKPIKPPPDVFLRLRTELNNPPTDNQAKQVPSGFLNVGDVSLESVMQGITQEPMTSADLHYKVGRDLRPEVTPFVLGFEDKVGDNQVKSMLNQHIDDANKVKQVREISRHRWTSAMNQMSAQLDAIDAMASKMDQDFKSSAQLVKVIDTMGEVLAPTQVKTRSPTRSLSPVKEDLGKSHQDNRFDAQLRANYIPPSYETTPYRVFQPSEAWTNQGSGRRNDHYKERLQEAYKLSSHEYDYQESSHHSSNSFSTRESDDLMKVDDIIDRNEDRLYETPLTLPHYNKMEVDEIERQQEITMKHDAHIKQILNDEEPSTAIKPWKNRTQNEKQDIRRWMETKRKERTIEYQQNVSRLRSNEKQPFHQNKTTSNSQLQETIRKREQERRELQSSNAAKRVDISIKLMKELKNDEKNLKEEKSRNLQASPTRFKRSPLKEANRSTNGTYKLHKSSTPYNKKQMKSSLRKTIVRKSSPKSTDLASSVEYPSDTSILSTWKLSDDLQRILYGSVDVTKPRKQPKNHVTFESRGPVEPRDSSSNISMSSSRNTESLLGDVNWNDVDMLVASVEG